MKNSEYNQISFPKINTFPNLDESTKRIKILSLVLIPLVFFCIIILYKFGAMMIKYLQKASEKRISKDREKLIFSFL